jgi:hypothetical protein
MWKRGEGRNDPNHRGNIGLIIGYLTAEPAKIPGCHFVNKISSESLEVQFLLKLT